jgi:hypothetical protein
VTSRKGPENRMVERKTALFPNSRQRSDHRLSRAILADLGTGI